MKTILLNGDWDLFSEHSPQPVHAIVPGSVLTDLTREHKIPNPYYRDNEQLARKLAEYSYRYRRSFYMDKEDCEAKIIELCCDCLDTLATVMVNEHIVAETQNMHIGYRFDISPYVREGENEISIQFASPLRYIEACQAAGDIDFAVDGGTKGCEYIRKTHSSFGWDWGPQMPDAGICEDIRIEIFKNSRLKDFHVTQHHQKSAVNLELEILADLPEDPSCLDVEIALSNPQGELLDLLHIQPKTEQIHHTVSIHDPQLWWPHNYGDQPLYQLTGSLIENHKTVSILQKKIGLRSLSVCRDKDQWGEDFSFVVNGKKIFAMGANYIPEDSLLGRRSRQRTKQLIDDCLFANFNMLRVWGGGYYPPDYFYDLCDEAGILVWQDFMFACNVYDVNQAFASSIQDEAIYQVNRLKDHSCLALWCGNNENEMGWVDWDFVSVSSEKHKEEYYYQTEQLLRNVVETHDPTRLYWPSSPCSGGSFIDTLEENKGDSHYWDVWAQAAPITEYRNHYIRFCSEFGFQSFPCMKTVESFTAPEDRHADSAVMLCHQKRPGANERILQYLTEQYGKPKDFAALLYGSQLMQAKALRYAVEHFRLHRGQCMGALYWQLNDCWPVASWSSVDYYGRYKAAHYAAKRFYAPLLAIANETNGVVEFGVTYENAADCCGSLNWYLRDNRSRLLQCGQVAVHLNGSGTQKLEPLDVSATVADKANQCYLEYELVIDGSFRSGGTLLFCLEKDFLFLDPHIQWDVTETTDRFTVTLHSEAYAKEVYLNLEQADGKFSDNWFDLHAGKPTCIDISKQSFGYPLSKEELLAQLTVCSVYNLQN